MTIIGGFNMGKFKAKTGMISVHDKGAFQAGLKFDKLDKIAEKQTSDLSKTEKRLLESSFVSRGKFHEKRGQNIYKQGPSYNTVSIDKSLNPSINTQPQKRMNIRVENLMGMKSNRGVFSQKTVDKGISNFYGELKKQDMDNKIFASKNVAGKITGIGIKNDTSVENYKFNKNKLAFMQKMNTPVPSLIKTKKDMFENGKSIIGGIGGIAPEYRAEYLAKNKLINNKKPIRGSIGGIGGIGGIAPEYRAEYLAKNKLINNKKPIRGPIGPGGIGPEWTHPLKHKVKENINIFKRNRKKRYFNPFTGEDI